MKLELTPPLAGAQTVIAFALPWIVRPATNELGTLAQQLGAIDLYLANPARKMDPAGAWQLARRLAMPHARRAQT